MKKSLIWFLAFFITISAAYYQRKTGPTYPKRIPVTVNDTTYSLKLVRSLALNERSEIKLNITDTTVKAVLYFKRFRSADAYQGTQFFYKTYPIDSYIMNSVFKMTEESGFFAAIPQQPPAGKLQYFIEITDKNSTQKVSEEPPVVIRYKGEVPGSVLTPHILIMFIAMMFSTAAGLLALLKIPSYKKIALWTFILLTMGGMILGPVVQKYAFGEFWTGIPFGWDLTDNKTLIAFIFWLLAVIMSYRKEKSIYTIVAALVLLMVYSIPHSLFGSELDYATGEVTQGIIFALFFGLKKKS